MEPLADLGVHRFIIMPQSSPWLAKRSLDTKIGVSRSNGPGNQIRDELRGNLDFSTTPPMGGHLGNPKNSGRVFRVSRISGFEICNPKFARNNENPTFRVPRNSGSGSGYPELPEICMSPWRASGGEVVMRRPAAGGSGGGGSVTPRGWSSAYAESVSMAQACVERRGDRKSVV